MNAGGFISDEEIRKQAEEKAAKEAAEKKAAEEQAAREAAEKKAAEEQAAREAAEEAQRQAEEEAQRQAEEEARRQAEEEAQRQAEEEARRQAEEEAQRQAEEEARRQAEEEANKEQTISGTVTSISGNSMQVRSDGASITIKIGSADMNVKDSIQEGDDVTVVVKGNMSGDGWNATKVTDNVEH